MAALKQGVDPPATASQLGLGVLVVVVIATMTYRRLREEQLSPARHKPSKRSAELTRGGTPAHILEHIARIGDPEYVCLSIAENKLTVGPLLRKLGKLAGARPPISTTTTSGTRGMSVAGSSSTTINTLNVTGDESAEIDSVEEYATTTAASNATVSSAASSSSEPAAHAAASLPFALSSASSSSSVSARIASMGYGDARGPLWVRRAVADMMGEHIFHREDVDPDNVVIAAGATSALRLLVLALTEEGQGCIIPGPYFPGFDKVLNVAGVRAWVANRDPGEGAGGAGGGAGGGGVEGGADEGISPRVLEAALRRAREADVEIRVLLITSPHNPTGRLYSPKALLAAVAWGRKRGLHIVVDEVYANCVHRPNASFRSVGSLLMAGGAKEAGRGGGEGEGMGNDVHVLYGLSKDLGIAGWRVGVLYSENKEVVAMVSKMAHTSQASSDTMDLVGRLFLEPGFLDDYFRQHQEGLRVAYVSLMNQLGRRGIMHLQAEAGLYVMLDLREFLENSSKEAEERLWRQMLERTKVNLTPGAAFHCVEPGWFRLCFAYQQTNVVTRAVDRVADFLEALMQERAAAREELEVLRQRREHQQQHVQQQQQRRRRRQQRQQQPLEAASAAVTAAAASTAAYVSASIRSARPTASGAAAEGKNNRQEEEEEEEVRSSTMLGCGSGANSGSNAGRARAGMWGREREAPEGADVGGMFVPPGHAAGIPGSSPGPAGDGGGDGTVRSPPDSSHRRPVVDTVPW